MANEAQSKLLYTAVTSARPLSPEFLNDAITAGADINWHCRAEEGRTVLHNVSARWNPARVRLLLQFGADPNALDETRNTPLHVAAGTCAAEVVEMLLKAGATINALNRYQSSPLHSAAFSRNESACRLLLAAGADPNAIDSDRRTALHWAAQHGSLPVCRLLLMPSPPKAVPAAPAPAPAVPAPAPAPAPPPCDLALRDDMLETAVTCAAPASEVQRFLVGRAAVHSLLLCCAEWLIRNAARLPAAGAELHDPSRMPAELREYFARVGGGGGRA